MKKLPVILIAAALTLSALPAFTACGNDDAEFRKHQCDEECDKYIGDAQVGLMVAKWTVSEAMLETPEHQRPAKAYEVVTGIESGEGEYYFFFLDKLEGVAALGEVAHPRIASSHNVKGFSHIRLKGDEVVGIVYDDGLHEITVTDGAENVIIRRSGARYG